MCININKAKPEDSYGINKVYYETWLKTYPNTERDISKTDIEKYLKDTLSSEKIEEHQKFIKNISEDTIILVAKKDEIIVGFAYLQNGNKKNKRSKLKAIYVHPKYQRLGIGIKLWNELQTFLGSAIDIGVRVVEYNTNAINFYKKLGFVPTGKKFSDEIEIKDGVFVTEVEMVMSKGIIESA